ncbi:MAG: aldo/keto reductase [Anaerolineae bacterium]|nr:MAG: aldo/keto reductase [Anaerolineae bacterium]
MKFETVHGITLPKIGFGCWTIGGEATADPSQDERSLAALRSALALGYTHFDTAEYYAAGHSEELLGQAIRQAGLPRQAVFITSKVSPNHLSYDDVLRSCENSLRRLGTDYLDLYLIHWPERHMNLPETFRALNRLVREGKVKHLGVSNFNLKLLQAACALSETPLLTNQVPYSLPDRSYVKNGVLDYCQKNDILLTAYSPVKSRFFKGKKLAEFARQRGVTPFQVGLAWLVHQPRVITIPTSFNPQHQAENLAAAELMLTDDEMAFLNGLAE